MPIETHTLKTNELSFNNNRMGARALHLVPDNDPALRSCSEFLRSREAAGRSPATVEWYAHCLARFLDTSPAWPPSAGGCQAFMLALRRGGMSDASVASYHRALRAFLNWCVRLGHIDHNPLTDLEKPSQPENVPRAIQTATLTRLFNAMRERADGGDLMATRDHALFRLIYDTGLRATEAARLRIADLDIERQAALIRRGKGGKSREVFFGRRTRAALRAWLAVVHPGSEWLFTSMDMRKGLRALTRSGVYQALQRWCDAADVERFRVHDLRHSYVIHALRRGVIAREVSDQAGHSDVAFTLRVYGGVTDEARRLSHLERSPGDEV